MNRKFFTTLICCLGLLTATLCRAGDINRMVVFGDSLSDPGNYFALFGDMSIQPFEPDNIPSAPYAIGGMHFTNGPTWIEQVATDLGIPESGSPAAVAASVFTNYAVGRSRARNLLLEDVYHETTLTTQVDSYLADTGGATLADAVHVIWIGANDLADVLNPQLGLDPNVVIGAAVGNTIAQVQRLYLAGARHFLVVTLPNFSLTPRIRQVVSSLPPEYQQPTLQSVTLASAGYNLALTSYLDLLQLVFADLRIDVLDSFSLLNEVAADPGAYSLGVVDVACLVPGVQGKTVCSNSNTYLFWDGQHPTSRAHGIIADAALMLLNSAD